MKLDLKHHGIIKNGKKTYFNPELYYDNIRQLEGKQFVEVIKEVHKKPSFNQCGYYRGGILVACHQSEMFSHYANKDEIHEDYFAPMFLGYKKLVTTKGTTKEIDKVRSLADLDMKEMGEFIDKVKIECDLNGIKCPEPSEYYNKYYRE